MYDSLKLQHKKSNEKKQSQQTPRPDDEKKNAKYAPKQNIRHRPNSKDLKTPKENPEPKFQ